MSERFPGFPLVSLLWRGSRRRLGGPQIPCHSDTTVGEMLAAGEIWGYLDRGRFETDLWIPIVRPPQLRRCPLAWCMRSRPIALLLICLHRFRSYHADAQYARRFISRRPGKRGDLPTGDDAVGYPQLRPSGKLERIYSSSALILLYPWLSSVCQCVSRCSP